MDEKEKKAIDMMEKAVFLSRIPTNFFLADIAYEQGIDKSFYYEWASKSESCAECLGLILTNLERTIHKAMRMKVITEKHGLFMLEREFGAVQESGVAAVKIEGVPDSEVQKILAGISNEVD